MEKTARVWLSALSVLALFASGCGSGSKSSGATAADTATGGPAKVVMQSLGFEPTAIRAKVGQRVVWRNEDNARHNVTYISGPRFSSSRHIISPGTSFSIRLTREGTIHYVCTIHPWMKATIVVSQ